jgi:hypothetical protein
MLNKLAKNIRRWFWEKVEGRQFHPPYSKCDEFSVRLQIRKKEGLDWEEVAIALSKTDYLEMFKNPGNCTKDKTRLICTWRVRKGNHRFCEWGNKNKRNNWHIDTENKKTKRELIKCLRKLAS